jgi:hypothetical protein
MTTVVDLCPVDDGYVRVKGAAVVHGVGAVRGLDRRLDAAGVGGLSGSRSRHRSVSCGDGCRMTAG